MAETGVLGSGTSAPQGEGRDPAEQLAHRRDVATEMLEHYLGPRPSLGVWRFDFDRARRRAGNCDFSRRRITISRYVAEQVTLAEFQQVVLHEIAHALAGPRVGHGPLWQSIAAEIGYTGGRTFDGRVADEPTPWLGRCPEGHEFPRYRRPSRPVSCSKCSRTFSEQHLITWHRR